MMCPFDTVIRFIQAQVHRIAIRFKWISSHLSEEAQLQKTPNLETSQLKSQSYNRAEKNSAIILDTSNKTTL